MLNKNSCFCLFTVALLIVCFTVAIPAVADNILVNGSFESPIVPLSSQCGPYSGCIGYTNAIAGQDNIGGWTVIGKNAATDPAAVLLLGSNYVEPDNNSGNTLFFHAYDGSQAVDLTGEGNQGLVNGIKQQVSTTAGLTYGLSFFLGHQFGAAQGYTNGPASIAVYLDGNLAAIFQNQNDTFEDVTWQRFSYTFTAASDQTVVAFLNNTPLGNNYAGLDDVQLQRVPEPSSMMLLGSGLLAAIVVALGKFSGSLRGHAHRPQSAGRTSLLT